MMRVAYVDSSVVVAVMSHEPNAEAMRERLKAFDKLFSGSLLEAEVRSAGRRKGVLARHVEACLAPVHLVLPHRSLKVEIEQVLGAGYLPGPDLWHVACAIYLGQALTRAAFVTLDEKQSEVAAKAGLEVVG